MNNDFNSLLISFLFSQMTYALQYKKQVDKIEENNENQNFKSNFESYGAILNLMFLQIEVRTEGLDQDVYLQNSTLNNGVYPLQFNGSNYTDDNFDVGDDDIVLQNYSDTSKAPSTLVREPANEIWKPKLANYKTFDGAWKALQRNVPQGFYSGAAGITAGDKVAAMVTIGCGLALAYVFELNREGIQVNSMKEVENVLAMFDMNQMTRRQPLSQTSLNIQSILENGSKGITRALPQEEREDKFAEILLDIASELPFGLNRVEIGLLTDIYKDNLIVKTFVGTLSELIVNELLLPSYKIPKVKAEKIARMDEIKDFLDYAEGLKDGTVALTGTDSKLYLCNKNITNAKAVFWDNWLKIFGSEEIIATNF